MASSTTSAQWLELGAPGNDTKLSPPASEVKERKSQDVSAVQRLTTETLEQQQLKAEAPAPVSPATAAHVAAVATTTTATSTASTRKVPLNPDDRLLTAAARNDLALIQQLLADPSAKYNINAVHRLGSLPALHHACREGCQVETLHALIQVHGANPNVLAGADGDDSAVSCVLDWGMEHGNLDAAFTLIAWLVQEGNADPSIGNCRLSSYADLLTRHPLLAAYLFATTDDVTVDDMVSDMLDAGLRSLKSSELSRFGSCEEVYRLYPSPVFSCLKMAALHGVLEARHPYEAPLHQSLHAVFLQTAVRVLAQSPAKDSEIGFLLERQHGLPREHTCMGLALRHKLAAFVTHERVGRIVQSWHFPAFYRQQSTDLVLMFFNGNRVARMKWLLDRIAYIVFLVFISVFAYRSPPVDQWRLSNTEGLLFFCYLPSRLYLLVSLMFHQGVGNWFRNGWNILDLTVTICLTVVACLRVFSGITAAASSDAYVPPDVIQWIYLVVTPLLILAAWLRVLFVVSQHPHLGPLLIALSRMVYDLVIFGILMVIIICAFGFCFIFLFAEKIPQYSTDSSSLLPKTLFLGAFAGNGLDYEVFDEAFDLDLIDYPRRLIAQILAGAFLVLTSIVLVNLLIAMMSSTFSAVQLSARNAYVYTRVESQYQYSQSPHLLPAPLTIVVVLPSACLLLYNVLLSPCLRGCMRCTTAIVDQCTDCCGCSDPNNPRRRELTRSNTYVSRFSCDSCTICPCAHSAGSGRRDSTEAEHAAQDGAIESNREVLTECRHCRLQSKQLFKIGVCERCHRAFKPISTPQALSERTSSLLLVVLFLPLSLWFILYAVLAKACVRANKRARNTINPCVRWRGKKIRLGETSLQRRMEDRLDVYSDEVNKQFLIKPQQ